MVTFVVRRRFQSSLTFHGDTRWRHKGPQLFHVVDSNQKINAALPSQSRTLSVISISDSDIDVQFSTAALRDDPFILGCRRSLVVTLDARENFDNPDSDASSGVGEGFRRRFESSVTFDDQEVDSVMEGQEDMDRDLAIFATISRKQRERHLEELQSAILPHLRRIVQEDAQRVLDDRIDIVEIGPESDWIHWEALEGLKPTHISISAGWNERVSYRELEKLPSLWSKVKSMEISGVGGETDSEDDPPFYHRLDALTLSYCVAFRFLNSRKPSNVTRLKIVQNDSLSTFIAFCKNIPGAQERLEYLYISSTNGCDTLPDGLGEVQARLKGCANLRHLTLILGGSAAPGLREAYDSIPDHELGFATIFPSSLLSLSFHCSAREKMLLDLDEWERCAQDKLWLPNLRSLVIKPDGPELDRLGSLDRNLVDREGKAKVDQRIAFIYAVLQNDRPGIHVGDGGEDR